MKKTESGTLIFESGDGFSRVKVRELITKIEDAIKTIDAQGVSIQIGNSVFGEHEATVKLVCTIGNPLDGIKRNFEANAWLFGLDPKDYGKRFTSRGEVFSVAGVNIRNTKYPILANKVSNGRRYKMSASFVRMALDREKA